MVFPAVQVLDELADAARKAKLGGLFGTFIGERNFQPFVQKGQLAQTLRERVKAEYCLVENSRIGMKRYARASLSRFAGLLQLSGRLAFFVGLFPHRAIARNFQFEPVRKGVDDGNADAVQTAGNFVGVTVEFSAGVQDREHHFRRWSLFRGVHVDGDAAAVIHHGDRIIRMYRDVDFIGVAGHGFVDGVVDDFPHQMVQAHVSRRADVHRGTQAHGFETAENFDRLRVVLMTGSFSGHRLFIAHVCS